LTLATLTSLVALALAAISGNLVLMAAQTVVCAACLMCVAFLYFSPRIAPDDISGLAVKPERQGDFLQRHPDAKDDKRWLDLVEAMVTLLDELERHRPTVEATAKDMIDHFDLRVQEILERSGVVVISGESPFDRARHRPENGGDSVSPGSTVVETVRGGLAVGPRVLRRAIVRLKVNSPQRQRETTT